MGGDCVGYTDTKAVHHLRRALASVKNGDHHNYNQLVRIFHRAGEEPLLETTLIFLSRAVKDINVTNHSSLLSSIFGINLWNYGLGVLKASVELIVELATFSGQYRDMCFEMLVNNFMPPNYFLDKLAKPKILEQKPKIVSWVLRAMEEIHELMLLAPGLVFSKVKQRMGTVHKKDHLIVLYVENIFELERSRIGEYVGSRILAFVIQRLRDLDVEIGCEATIKDDSSKSMFGMELDDLDDAAEAMQDDDEFSRIFIDWKSLSANITVDLLDTLMVLTFKYLESCKKAGRLEKIFKDLCESFECLVLNVYKPKFVQFVMFYACALDPNNSGERFSTELADIFVCTSKPPLTRMNAVAYLASYISRAKFLKPSTVVSTLERLLNWCGEYCRIPDGNRNPKLHKVFYSGCQAIMYILCFHMKSIMDDPDLKSQLLLMPLEEIFRDKLNALEVCLPLVVAEFLRQAKAARLYTVSEMFIFDDLQESGHERLDSFFPFDPCLLKKSERLIRGHYVYCSMVKKTIDAEDDPEVLLNANGEMPVDEEMAASLCPRAKC